jgi:hypothetical protein
MEASVEMLLLLSALLASLTGSSGGPSRPAQAVTIVRAVEVAQSAVRSGHQAARPAATPQSPTMERNGWPRLISAPLPTAHLPFERRLE